jgi:hypothetical protein
MGHIFIYHPQIGLKGGLYAVGCFSVSVLINRALYSVQDLLSLRQKRFLIIGPKNTSFWDMMPCRLVEIYRHSGGRLTPSSGWKNKQRVFFYMSIVQGIFMWNYTCVMLFCNLNKTQYFIWILKKAKYLRFIF